MNLAQLFANKATSIPNIEYIKKIITLSDNTNAEQYILRNRGKMIKGKLEELKEYRSTDNQNTLLHLYQLPIDLTWKKNSLLYLFLTNFNFNFFAKNQYQVPAIIELCSNVKYRKYIDWWVSGKLSNENSKEKFVKKISKYIDQSEKKASKSNNEIIVEPNSILFYFTTICRLRQSTHMLNLKDIGIEKENIENSINLRGALFYCLNFMRDPKKGDNSRLTSLYNNRERLLHIETLRDPVFNITLKQNSRFMRDHKPFLDSRKH